MIRERSTLSRGKLYLNNLELYFVNFDPCVETFPFTSNAKDVLMGQFELSLCVFLEASALAYADVP